MTERKENGPPARIHSFPERRDPGFVQRVMIIYGIGAVFLLVFMLLWYAASVILLVFSSILVAVLLHDATCALEKRLPLPHGASLAAVLLLTAGLLTLAGWFFAPQIAAQTRQLITDMPAAWERVREYLESHAPLQEIVRMLPAPEELLKNASSIMSRAGTVFSGVLGVIGNTAVVLFVAIYLAYQPGIYTKGIIKLVPPALPHPGLEVMEL